MNAHFAQSLGIALEMSEVKDVIISPCSETVIAEAESVASSVDEEIFIKMEHYFRGLIIPRIFLSMQI